MLFTIITSFTVLHVPGLLIYHSRRDAWLALIIAWFLDVILAIVYAYMGIRFPGENFVQYSITILGKYLGKVIGLMFPIFFLITASLLMRTISLAIDTTVLPRTPMFVVLCSGYILIAYCVKKGIEVIARSSEILGPIYLLSFAILFILVSPSVKLERLMPQLADGFYPVFTGGIFILSFIGICIMMAMFIPICNRIENGFLAKFIAVSIGTIVVSILIFFCIGVFGAEQAGNMRNPGLQLSKMISIANIVDRLEILWFMNAIAAAIMASVTLIWSASLGISQIMGLSSYKPIVYPVTLISLILSIISFDSNMEVMNFIFYTFPFIGVIIETGLEMFLFIMALILKKRGKAMP